MTSPFKRAAEALGSVPPERLDELEAEVRERRASPGYTPPEVQWPPESDPLGMGWEWLGGPSPTEPASAGAPSGDDPSAGAEPATTPHGRWRKRTLWASGIAASIAAVALGGWYVLSRGPLTDVTLTAWASNRLLPGGDGISLTAAPGDEEADKPPLVLGGERPIDSKPPSQPNIYAPLRVQRQLILQGVAEGAGSGAPIQVVAETVRPKAIFYLEFSPAGGRGEGTAVAVRLRPGPSATISQEVWFQPADGTTYIGPLEMGDGEAEYLLVIADRRGEPLLKTVDAALGHGRAPVGDDSSLRASVANALGRAGHRWYGLQRVMLRPDTAGAR